MSWLKQKLKNWILYDREDECGVTVSSLSSNKVSTSHDRLGNRENSMNFQIMSATGGYILEYSNYDERRDTWTRNLHIITDDQDLGDSISKIITIELLRK